MRVSIKNTLFGCSSCFFSDYFDIIYVSGVLLVSFCTMCLVVFACFKFVHFFPCGFWFCFFSQLGASSTLSVDVSSVTRDDFDASVESNVIHLVSGWLPLMDSSLKGSVVFNASINSSYEQLEVCICAGKSFFFRLEIDDGTMYVCSAYATSWKLPIDKMYFLY